MAKKSKRKKAAPKRKTRAKTPAKKASQSAPRKKVRAGRAAAPEPRPGSPQASFSRAARDNEVSLEREREKELEEEEKNVFADETDELGKERAVPNTEEEDLA